MASNLLRMSATPYSIGEATAGKVVLLVWLARRVMLPLLAAGISVSLPSLAVAQQAKNPEAQPLSTQDAKLLQEIRRSDVTMIAAAKIALSRAKLEAVKKYAQLMEDTHSKLLEDGNKVAKLKLGQVPPAHGDANHGRALQTLKDASDDRFGRVYAEWAIGAEGQALDVARRVTSEANDPNLKALGANAAAHIEMLLKTARELAQSLDKQPEPTLRAK
jgi:predicted outer membrane protein